MLNETIYVAALRTGQNDVKALCSLESNRKDQLAPLLSVTGKAAHTDNFLKSWGASPFLLDTARGANEETKDILHSLQLNEPAKGFANKLAYFAQCAKANGAMIPVVGWKGSDSNRNIVQFALALKSSYPTVGVRLHLQPDAWKVEIDRLSRIVDALPDLDNLVVIADRADGPHDYADFTARGWIWQAISAIKAVAPATVVNLHTSFPAQKPPSGTSDLVSCTDLPEHAVLSTSAEAKDTVYGDYAGTNPAEAIEYVPGMPVLPFTSYLTKGLQWLRIRDGADKEFSKYIDIARAIRAHPGYHNDHFCWGTKEIARIAALQPGVGQGYGANGTWNGIRVNQHMCAILDLIGAGAGDVSFYAADDGED